MKEKISGRIDETGILAKALHSVDPEFIAVYGHLAVHGHGRCAFLPDAG
jgi:hypothetical protein